MSSRTYNLKINRVSPFSCPQEARLRQSYDNGGKRKKAKEHAQKVERHTKYLQKKDNIDKGPTAVNTTSSQVFINHDWKYR